MKVSQKFFCFLRLEREGEYLTRKIQYVGKIRTKFFEKKQIKLFFQRTSRISFPFIVADVGVVLEAIS